jgi:hypothetical protein
MAVRRPVVVALCAALAAVALPRPGWAQDVSGPSLKAAYIYRFALFTEWPAEVLAPGAPLTMCVVGDTAVRDALEQTVRKATGAARPVVVAFGPPDKLPSPCHTLYVSGVSSAQAARALAGVRQLPVLTMSDIEGFNRMGGIAEFFFEAGQLRFAIRPDAVAQSHLQLSSLVLRLARPSR